MNLEPLLTDSTKQYRDCIQASLECWLACEACATACLQEEQVQTMVGCIRMDRECATVCRDLVELMIRGDEAATAARATCALVCDRCAAECAQHEAEHCQRCAEACRRCAEVCRSLG